MTLNLQALYALRAFVEGGSVAQAAARVHRTPPQVSRLLTSLQDTAGFPVLRKEGRSLTLTPEGREFYEKVALMLRAADEVQRFSRDSRQRRQNHVRVLAAPHIAEGLLAQALATLKARQPALSASVDARGTRDIEALLGQGLFDVALTQLPLQHPRVRVQELVRSQAVAVMHAAHPLAGQARISAAHLQQHSLVLLPPYSVIRQRCEALLGQPAGQAHLEVTNGPLAAQLAARGAGLALTDPFAALAQRPLGAVIRPFEPAIALSYGMALPKGQPVSALTRALLATLRQVAAQGLQSLGLPQA